ncbi:MAG: hypothetical protein RL721_489 [Candidatus Eisenbacteria bacterium]|jgi:hypothetical protein
MQEVDGSIPFSSTINVPGRSADAPLRAPRSGPRGCPGGVPVMVFALIVLAAASRLLPHPPNFAPVAAIGLFAGAYSSRRAGWLVPFAALLASDAVLGFYHPVGMLWNYLAFAACLLLGSGWLARRRTALRLGGAVVSSALAFFVISNFGMWASGYYPRTWAGLVECYVAALPFLRNTLLSDVLYSAALFGGYALLARFVPRRDEVTARA